MARRSVVGRHDAFGQCVLPSGDLARWFVREEDSLNVQTHPFPGLDDFGTALRLHDRYYAVGADFVSVVVQANGEPNPEFVFIRKPFQPSALLQTVRKLVAHDSSAVLAKW